jgi:hypothetical protein
VQPLYLNKTSLAGQDFLEISFQSGAGLGHKGELFVIIEFQKEKRGMQITYMFILSFFVEQRSIKIA